MSEYVHGMNCHCTICCKAPKTEFQQLSEQIAALAAGLTARDKQLSALSEQVRKGFFDAEQLSLNVGAKNGVLVAGMMERLERLETAIKGLGEQLGQVVQDTSMIRALVSLGGVAAAPKQESFDQTVHLTTDARAIRIEKQEREWKAARSPKQKQRR